VSDAVKIKIIKTQKSVFLDDKKVIPAVRKTPKKPDCPFFPFLAPLRAESVPVISRLAFPVNRLATSPLSPKTRH
jgi:hypothetical protein